MTEDFFFYGTLCHLPLLNRVLGREVVARPARMAGWRAVWAEGRPHPMLVEAAGGLVEGLHVPGLSPADVDRLDFYEGGFDFLTRRVTVDTEEGPREALVYFTAPDAWAPGRPWRLEEWQARFGDEVTATALDVMALFGRVPAEKVLDRYGQMLVRGASRARAMRDPAPAALRRAAEAGDVDIRRHHLPYAKFFAVEEYDLRFLRFDGTMGATINRAAFVSGDAVTVLPYDPIRDRVLLIEQFRTGPFARGDRNPWSLEAIAGRIDPGETPEDCARREAVEEAGLTIGALEEIARYYPSPAAKSEFLYSYLALTDLPDGISGVFGVAAEAEDIRGHLVGFDDLMALVASGEIGNAPLLLSVLWLQRERPRLRKG